MFAPGQAEESGLQAPQACPKDPSGDPSSEDSLFSGSLISSPRTEGPAPPSVVTSFHSSGPGSARHPWVPCTSAQISLVAPCWSVNLQHTHVYTRIYTYTYVLTHTALPVPAPFHMVFSTFWQNWSTSSPASWVENQEQRLHSLWTTNISSNSIFDLRCTPQSLVTWCLPK